MSVCRSSHFLPFMVVMSVSFVTCSLHGAGAAGKFRVSRRAKNRWLVAVTMIQNPSVIASRRGTNTDSGWDNTVNNSDVGGADYSAKDAKVTSHDVSTVEPDIFCYFLEITFHLEYMLVFSSPPRRLYNMDVRLFEHITKFSLEIEFHQGCLPNKYSINIIPNQNFPSHRILSQLTLNHKGIYTTSIAQFHACCESQIFHTSVSFRDEACHATFTVCTTSRFLTIKKIHRDLL